MSKITQALEKAARERLQRTQDQITVLAAPVLVPVIAPSMSQGLGEVTPAGHVQIDPHIVAAADTTSAIAEQYRILRTNLQALRLKPGPKVIAITSAVTGEGKSVTSLNLALALAQQERLKVVLVDADMRKSSIPRWLGLPDRHVGLSTVLQRQGELDGSLVSLQSPRLTVLPAGPVAEQPAELLGSTAFKRLLAALRAQFDVIIIDAPPVLPVADPGIIAAQTDGVLLVVRAGKTQRKTVLHAQELLKQMKATLLGCVLTHVEYYLPSYRRYYEAYRDRVQDGEATDQKPSSAHPPARPISSGRSNERPHEPTVSA